MNKLAQLIDDLPISKHHTVPLPESEVRGIKNDSRQVSQGDIFVAVKGGSVDGHQYVSSAIGQGAVAIVGTEEISETGVPYIRVEDSREALAWLAAAYYDHPARSLRVIGVTGTDGKTTTCNLLFNILKAAGLKTGLISTVNAVIMDKEIDTGFHVTTPEAMDVQRYLRMMLDAGITHVVLETTSHGLIQHRVTGCEYDIAVVTNITHEHLDFHGSYEGYLGAKARLFEMLQATPVKPIGNLRFSVLNADDPSYLPLREKAGSNFVSYSTRGKGMLNAEDIHYAPQSLHFTARSQDQSFDVGAPFPGEFNVSNCLAAIGASVFGLKVPPEAAVRGIAQTQGVPGRMQRIEMGQDFAAVVDFAHTPNALHVALEALRKMTTGRLIAVFGSAGLRDREKRGMMAQVGIQFADLSIFTAEDPRTESLDGILEEMANAARRAGGVEGEVFHRVPDRGEAIQMGVDLAQPGDLVASFGKGHEQSMCFGSVEYPWDDRIAMRAAIAKKMGISGPKMPVLPTSRKDQPA